METTCHRCHQTVEPGASFCPYCGLPQLIYSADTAQENNQVARWDEAVRDAGSVAWRPALRLALLLAVPAGLAGALLGIPGLLVMAFAGAWAVSLYVRSQQPPWITMGAGARIGLAFGLIAAWLAFAASGGALFFNRYALHKGTQMDAEWKRFVDLDAQVTQKFAESLGMSGTEAEQQQVQNKSRMLSPEGHAGMVTGDLALSSLLFVLFAMTGGAVSARLQSRRQRPRR